MRLRAAYQCASWIALHVALVLPLVPLSYFLYGNRGTLLPFPAVLALWVLFGLAAIGALLTAMAHPRAYS